MKHFGLLILLTLTFAACASPSNGVIVRNVQHFPLYSPQLVRWAGGDRDFPLQIVAPGDATASKAWSSAVAASLAGMTTQPFSRATSDPDGTERGNFRIVAVIDAPLGISARQVCRNEVPVESLGKIEGTSHVQIVFCNERRPVSTARAIVAPITSPQAPQLEQAVVAAATGAFPRQDPSRSTNRGDAFMIP